MPECKSCRLDKPAESFGRRASSPTGLHYYCRACNSQKASQWAKSNPEAAAEKHRDWRLKNADRLREYQSDYRKANSTQLNENRKEWLKSLPEDRRKRAETDASRKAKKSWKAKNPASVTAEAGRRRAAKLNATPSWADRNEVESVYKAAREAGMTVDHIVPLRSSLVCGLHVPANLALVTLTENIRKGNRRWPDMPGSEK